MHVVPLYSPPDFFQFPPFSKLQYTESTIISVPTCDNEDRHSIAMAAAGLAVQSLVHCLSSGWIWLTSEAFSGQSLAT